MPVPIVRSNGVLGGIVSSRLPSISLLTAEVNAPRPAPHPEEIDAEGNDNDRDDRLLRLQGKQRWIIHDQMDVGRDRHHHNRGQAGESRQKPQDEEYADANLCCRNNPHIERVERDAGSSQLAGKRRAEVGNGELHHAGRQEE